MNDFCVNLCRVNTKDFSIVYKDLYSLAPGSLLDFISPHISLIPLCSALQAFFHSSNMQSKFCLECSSHRYPQTPSFLWGFLFKCHLLSRPFTLCKMSTDPVLPIYYVYQNMYTNYINYVLIKYLICTI